MSINVNEQIENALEKLKWEKSDEIVVEIGGVAVTGTATSPTSNPKWSKPFGTVSYQNDSFIIIKNKSRNPVIPSQPNPELKQQHSYQGENK